jgi:hypothetical protein
MSLESVRKVGVCFKRLILRAVFRIFYASDFGSDQLQSTTFPRNSWPGRRSALHPRNHGQLSLAYTFLLFGAAWPNGFFLSPVQVEAPFIRGMEPFGGMSLPQAPLSRQMLYGCRTDYREEGYMAIAGRL